MIIECQNNVNNLEDNILKQTVFNFVHNNGLTDKEGAEIYSKAIHETENVRRDYERFIER